jgi:hypothetical protein
MKEEVLSILTTGVPTKVFFFLRGISSKNKKDTNHLERLNNSRNGIGLDNELLDW